MATMTYLDAGMAALAAEMRRDAKILHLCTEAPDALLAEFGAERVRQTPIAESASNQRNEASRAGDGLIRAMPATTAASTTGRTTRAGIPCVTPRRIAYAAAPSAK